MSVPRRVWVAAGLWMAFAAVVWNVVFDRIIVLAGRRYVYAATLSANRAGQYLLIDDWMRPAVTRALWMASTAGLAVAVLGLCAVAVAYRRDGRMTDRK